MIKVNVPISSWRYAEAVSINEHDGQIPMLWKYSWVFLCVESYTLVLCLLDAVVRDDFYAVDLGGFGILGDYICSETHRCASDSSHARLSFWEVTTGRRYVDHYVGLIGPIKLQIQ